MSSDLVIDCEDQPRPTMDSDSDSNSFDLYAEWDVSLFDELDGLGDAETLLDQLEHAAHTTEDPDLDFDIDLPCWNGADTGSTCADGDMSVGSLSPAHTLSLVPSPVSVDTSSPYSLSDEALYPKFQLSPVSVCSESSGSSDVPPAAKRASKRTSQATRAQPVKRPIQRSAKVSIQPKPVITAVPFAQAAAPLQPKTIIIHPLQAAMLPVVKQAPVSIQPTPPPGHPMMLSQTGQVLQLQTQQAVTGHVVTMPTLSQDRRTCVTAPPMFSFIRRASSSDDTVSQRQLRIMKNRESASLSRKRKKEYLLKLEARLKMALNENEVLKHENGILKRQLEGLLSENTGLKTAAPKRRAVCLMVVLVFVMLSVGPIGVFQGGPGSTLQAGPVQHSGRHLLDFSPEAEAEVGPEPLGSGTLLMADSSEAKALMVVKDPVFLRPPPPCQTPINRTKCIELAHELRGWVHRHEVEQTKSRRLSNSHHKHTRTILKTKDKEADGAQVLTVRYTETTEEKIPGSELQVYYAPHRTYSDFFDEINRRGDTFYVLSFRRDHLLLPATNHNKGSRPKMSVVLPAVNINESIIRDKDFEVMMQIDCEVTDTRILHIKSSTIPPLLRVNHTDTFYQASRTNRKAAPPVAVLMGSA